MFKKIEIWVLYLSFIFFFIIFIVFGGLALREYKGGYYRPIITPISKVALFLIELPSNMRSMLSDDQRKPLKVRDRFPDIDGFKGEGLDYEAYILLSRFDANINQSIVELIDLQSFDILHTWNPDVNEYFKNIDKSAGTKWENIDRDRADHRFRIVHPFLSYDGNLIFKYGSPLLSIDKTNKLVWMNDDYVHHHSIEKDSDNHLWVPVHFYPYKIDKKYVGNSLGTFYDDGIRQISTNGEVLFEESVTQIFINNGLEYLLFAVGDRDVFVKDPLHLNDIQPVLKDSEFWKKGDLFLSFRHQSMVILYRPSTGKIIWKSAGKFFHQHDVNILDDHRISIFNNNSKDFYNGDFVDGHNEIIVYDFEKKSYSSYLKKSLEDEDVRTVTAGRGRILLNGDLFIEEGNHGRILYFNKDGSLRWTYVNRSKNGEVFRPHWSRVIDDPVDMKIIHKFFKIKN